MIIPMDKLCRLFSSALDIIEEEQIGASEYHSMRVAALCTAMGKKLGYNDDALSALAACALFHDNALNEFPLSKDEITGEIKSKMRHNANNMILHCERGQQNAAWLPFKKDISGYILYHHERGDGKGPFGKREGEYPFEAALIAAADSVDLVYKLQRIKAGELSALRDKIAQRSSQHSTHSATAALLDVLDNDMLESLRDENIAETLNRFLPRWEADASEHVVLNIARFIAKIIDFKSKFTSKHTTQIASRSWLMAGHYGYNPKECTALYLAASLHDIGKISTPIEVLEKPGKLDKEEYQIIMKHVQSTYDWLCEIPDLGVIINWAAGHHEKLDGTGYPFGKKGSELDFNTRLIACLDIYQAVSEPRPYHSARSHEETMVILFEMAGKGFIDAKIVKDLDDVMRTYSMRDIPPPVQ